MPARKAAALTQSVFVRLSRGNRSQRAPAAAKGVPTAMRSLGDAKQSCNSGRRAAFAYVLDLARMVGVWWRTSWITGPSRAARIFALRRCMLRDVVACSHASTIR